MVQLNKIQVMISSRCNDSIQMKCGDPVTLTEIRSEIKCLLENQRLLGEEVFSVWINEDSPSASADHDSWATCMQQVRNCDILLVLYNGNAGWAGPADAGGIGICHAELYQALASAQAKVRVIDLIKANAMGNPSTALDEQFQKYVDSQSRFSARVETGNEAIEKSLEAVRDTVVHLVGLGKMEATRGRFHTGAALDWTRLSYRDRQNAMVGEARAFFRGQPAAASLKLENRWTNDAITEWHIEIEGRSILFCCHGIPDAMSVAAARELVGQPFLHDYLIAEAMSNECVGPVHVILCHKGVTELQAQRHLGFSDAIVVNTPFGIYVADRIQKVQMVFVRDCRDQYATRQNLQRLFDWLTQTEESRDLSERAEQRKRIIDTIAAVSEP